MTSKELFQAVLDGKTVQWCNNASHEAQDWHDYDSTLEDMMAVLAMDLRDAKGYKYRIKPELVVWWLAVHPVEILAWADRSKARDEVQAFAGSKLLRLELDPDSLDVISCRTEAP